MQAQQDGLARPTSTPKDDACVGERRPPAPRQATGCWRAWSGSRSGCRELLRRRRLVRRRCLSARPGLAPYRPAYEIRGRSTVACRGGSAGECVSFCFLSIGRVDPDRGRQQAARSSHSGEGFCSHAGEQQGLGSGFSACDGLLLVRAALQWACTHAVQLVSSLPAGSGGVLWDWDCWCAVFRSMGRPVLSED